MSYEEKSLAKKVLLSVVAAGVMSSFVVSAEAADKIVYDDGQSHKYSEAVGVESAYVHNGSSIELNGGNVTGFKEEHQDPDDDRVGYADSAAESRHEGSQIIANNVNFKGEIRANEGGTIILNGGSVTSGTFYYTDAQGSGPIEDYPTEIGSRGTGSYVELNKVKLDTNLGAFESGILTVNDSNVNAATAIYAEGGTINLNSTDGNAKYIVGSYGVLAEDGGIININGGGTFEAAVNSNLPEGCEPQGLSFKAQNGGTINIDSGKNKATIIAGLDLTDAHANIKGDVEFKNGNVNIGVSENPKSSTLVTEAGSKLSAMNLTAFGKESSINANGTVDLSYIGVTDGATATLNGGKVDYTKELKDDKVLPGVRWDRAVLADYANLTANNVDFIGDVRAYVAGKIKLTGGSVTAGYVYEDGKIIKLTGFVAEYDDPDRGQSIAEADGVKLNTNVVACHAGKVIVKNSTVDTTNEKKIYAYVKAENDKSTVDLINTSITSDSLLAIDGGKLTVDEKTLAKVDTVEADKGIIEFGGNLTANSVLADNNSSITFVGNENSTYNVTKAITAKNGSVVNIYGGNLKADNIREMLKDTTAQSIVLDKNGVISTMSDQIYANAASANQKESGAITNEGIDFKGGKLILNDAKYTQSYLDSAQAELKKQNNGNGKTTLTMKGELVKEESGEVIKDITVDEASEKYGSDTELDKVTAKADNNLLVGSKDTSLINKEIADVTVKQQVENGFAVGKLDLGAESDGVIITNDKEVTLGGSQGGSVITVAGADKDVKVVVGADVGAEKATGNLNIGNALATEKTKYTLNGEIVVNEDSNLNISGQTEITKNLSLNNAMVNVAKGALKTPELKVAGSSNLFGEVNADKLNVVAGATLLVGDKDDAGRLTVEKATLNGGMLFLDPAFKDGATIGDASGFAVTDASSALDGAYVAGQNSKLSFGADLKAAEAVFAKTGETWGEKGVTAAAYIAKSIDLGTAGSITVDGSKNVAPTVAVRNVTFADNSLLMVDGTATKNAAAITGVTSATVADSSKLYIDNAKKDETYKIFAGVDNGWKADNISSNNKLLKFTVDEETDDAYNVTATSQAVEDVYGKDVIAPNTFNQAVIVGGAVADFLVNAADEHVNATKAAQVSALNSAAAMSELAGVSHGTYATSNLLTDAVADHMSLANEKEHDIDIWAKYIHTKEDVDGLSIASFGADYDAQYNGIVVGADLYKNGKATVGAALTYVDGNINGNTLAARTKNDATYYGASIYGGIASDDSAVIGDISYLHGKNDITQYNSGATLTADAKSDAFSIGVRAEKSVKAGVGKFVPYAGIRYMHLGTGNYTNSIGMSYDADDMNLWLLPVGVKYSADVKAGAWTIRPLAEVGYVWNMGDRDSTQTVSLNGASDGFGYDVTDSGSYIGRFMIEAEKANVTYGLGYEYQKGDSVKANRWMANLNWKF